MDIDIHLIMRQEIPEEADIFGTISDEEEIHLQQGDHMAGTEEVDELLADNLVEDLDPQDTGVEYGQSQPGAGHWSGHHAGLHLSSPQ